MDSSSRDGLVSPVHFHIICRLDHWANYAWSSCWRSIFFCVAASMRRTYIWPLLWLSKFAPISACCNSLQIGSDMHSGLYINPSFIHLHLIVSSPFSVSWMSLIYSQSVTYSWISCVVWRGRICIIHLLFCRALCTDTFFLLVILKRLGARFFLCSS
jgi:hypothetical protein